MPHDDLKRGASDLGTAANIQCQKDKCLYRHFYHTPGILKLDLLCICTIQLLLHGAAGIGQAAAEVG